MAYPPPKSPLKNGASARPPRDEDVLARAKREKDELEGACIEAEEELEEIKVRYEKYFLGVERKPPHREREELKRKVLRLKTAFTRNAGLKFRVQGLHARFLSYERMWERSVREKEEGTYHRDLFKARLHREKEEAAAAKEATRREEAPPPLPPAARTAATSPAAARPAPAAPGARTPPPAARPAGSAAPSGGMGEAQLRALYDAYVAAKKSCKEDVSRLTYDAVAKSVSKQIPDLMARYKAKSVEFKVEVKNGKAVLKAVPKV